MDYVLLADFPFSVFWVKMNLCRSREKIRSAIVKSELFRATFIAPFEIRLDKRVPQNAAIIGL